MSQVNKAPREFKFVGAFSRKRRSRKAPPAGPTGPKRRAVVTSTVPHEHARAAGPAVSASGSNSTDARNADEAQPVEGAPPPTATQPTQVQPSLATPLLVCEENPNHIASHIMANPSNEGTSQGNDVDWSCSSLMNPFLDPGPSLMTPFHQINEDYQSPICFGSDILIMSPEGTSSTDDSPQSDYPVDPTLPNEVANRATTDGVVLPSLSSQQAPSNVGLTIPQLLNRCMARHLFKFQKPAQLLTEHR